MKTSSAKAKGRRACAEVIELLKRFSAVPLGDGDLEITTSSVPGEDIRMSPAARKQFPFAIESKNQEKLQIWSALEQAESYRKEDRIPLLFFRRNRSKLYVALDAEEFFELTR